MRVRVTKSVNLHKGDAKKVLEMIQPTQSLKEVYKGKIIRLKDTSGNHMAYIGQITDITGYYPETAQLRVNVNVPGLGEVTTTIHPDEITAHDKEYWQRRAESGNH